MDKPGSWGEVLLRHLSQHVAEEQELLAAYEDLEKNSSDDFVRFLASLIREDERRHHDMFRRLRNDVDASLRGTSAGSEPGLPVVRHTMDEAEELLEASQRLLAAERDDLEQMRELQRLIGSRQGTAGFWMLLVELAGLDTQKHIRILEFMQRAAQSRLA